MMDSIEAKLEAMMNTKINGLKGEIMEGLKKLLIERPPKVTMYPMKFVISLGQTQL